MSELFTLRPAPALEDAKQRLAQIDRWIERHDRNVQRPSQDFEIEDIIKDIGEIVRDIYFFLEKNQRHIDGILNVLTDLIRNRHMAGNLADRPAAAESGRQYLATDQSPVALFIDDGTSWHQYDAV